MAKKVWHWLDGELFLEENRSMSCIFFFKATNWWEEGKQVTLVTVCCDDFAFAEEIAKRVRKFYVNCAQDVFDLLKEISRKVIEKYNKEPEFDIMLSSIKENGNYHMKIWFAIE